MGNSLFPIDSRCVAVTAFEKFKDRLTLVIRLTTRQEHNQDSPPSIAGQLTCLESGRRANFAGFDTLRRHIEAEIARPAPNQEDPKP